MINTYFSNGQNATQTYLAHHPNAKYTTAESNGHKWLRKAKIQAEIARRLKAEQGITKQALESDLIWCAEKAKAAEDYAALASIVMDCAKLGGFLVEKHEVSSVSSEEQQQLKRLAEQMIQQLRHTPPSGSPCLITSVQSPSPATLPPVVQTDVPLSSDAGMVRSTVEAFNQAEQASGAASEGGREGDPTAPGE